MRIDAHQHFWQTARGDYGWLTPAIGPLWRDFMPADLAPLLADARIDRTILVQAAPTEAEAAFLLDLAHRTPFVAGVVGWTDFASPDAPERIAALAADPLLVGLRPMVQDIADDTWLARIDLRPAFEAMLAHDLVFDALVLPRHLVPLLRVLDRHPDLAVVVDHAAKPDIRAGRYDRWRADLAAVAAHPRTFVKLSGLATEAGPGWRAEDLLPVARQVLESFGPRRTIFGSDWPVLTLAGDYAGWLAAAEELCGNLGASDRDAVFGGNAARVYLRNRGRR